MGMSAVEEEEETASTLLPRLLFPPPPPPPDVIAALSFALSPSVAAIAPAMPGAIVSMRCFPSPIAICERSHAHSNFASSSRHRASGDDIGCDAQFPGSSSSPRSPFASVAPGATSATTTPPLDALDAARTRSWCKLRRPSAAFPASRARHAVSARCAASDSRSPSSRKTTPCSASRGSASR
eukprot:30060-Pelagococcus_subviridis.AAC.14